MDTNVNKTEQEFGITLNDLLIILRKYLLIILSVTIIFGGACAGLSLALVKTSYTATASILFDASAAYEPTASQEGVSYDRYTFQFSKEVLPTFLEFIPLEVVLGHYYDYAEQKGLVVGEDISKDYRGSLSIDTEEDSLIVKLTYTSTMSADFTINTLNTLVHTLEYASTLKVGDKYLYDFLAEKPKVMDEATKASESNSWLLYTIIAALIGFVLSYGLMLILDIMDNTIRTKRVLEATTGFNALAFIEDIEVKVEKNNANDYANK